MGEGQFAFDADEEVLSQADLLIEQAAVDLPALIRTTSEISDLAIISGDTSDSVLTLAQVCSRPAASEGSMDFQEGTLVDN